MLCFTIAGNTYLQYSNNQQVICPGLQITFDTNVGNGFYNVDAAGDCSEEPVENSDDEGGDDGGEGEGIPGGRLVSRPKKNGMYGPNRKRS